MNLLKKILRTVQTDGGSLTTATEENLEQLVIPLLKTATKINVQACTAPPDNSQFRSHFGGQPYFEIGESWPVSKAGVPLQFVFQIFNEEGHALPESIKLVQLFYDFQSGAHETADDGWLVKIYGGLDMERAINLPRPEPLEETNFCELLFEEVHSLPDWEGIDLFSPDAVNISAALNQEDQWEHYEKVAEKLAGQAIFRSQLGGYPKWLLEENTPALGNGYMDLLFQITAEENAGIMWGSSASMYVFYDPETKQTEFVFQYQ